MVQESLFVFQSRFLFTREHNQPQIAHESLSSVSPRGPFWWCSSYTYFINSQPHVSTSWQWLDFKDERTKRSRLDIAIRLQLEIERSIFPCPEVKVPFYLWFLNLPNITLYQTKLRYKSMPNFIRIMYLGLTYVNQEFSNNVILIDNEIQYELN